MEANTISPSHFKKRVGDNNFPIHTLIWRPVNGSGYHDGKLSFSAKLKDNVTKLLTMLPTKLVIVSLPELIELNVYFLGYWMYVMNHVLSTKHTCWISFF